MMSTPAPAPAVCESVDMVRFLLAAAADGGADVAQLARAARVPGWALACDRAMISPRHALRLWELAEHALEDPQVALRIVGRHTVGDLDLYDYLFTTAATLRDGLRTSSRYLHLLTTNGQLQVEAKTDRETTYSYRCADAGGRGAELYLRLRA